MKKTGPKSKFSKTSSVPGSNLLKKKLKSKTKELILDDFENEALLQALSGPAEGDLSVSDSSLVKEKEGKRSTTDREPRRTAVKTDPEDDEDLYVNSQDPEENETGEGKLLDDLVWVYKHLGGRKKLLGMMRKDPKLRAHFLRLMLTLEIKKEMEGSKGSGKKSSGDFQGKSKRNFFFIMRGLDETKEKKVLHGLKSGKIQAGDISRILNPEQDDYQAKLAPEPISHSIPKPNYDGVENISEDDMDAKLAEIRKEFDEYAGDFMEEALEV